ncbi:MAG TPA: methyl-accepting chemotaxis protein [Ignavibacteriales bacterium]|nr:methyl-accepting chemotaxis protein [Ignavibacteriales bacterium]
MINERLNTDFPGALSPTLLSDNKELDLIPLQSIGSKISRAINLLSDDYYSFGKLIQENYNLSKQVVNTLIDITGLVSDAELKSELEVLSSTIGHLAEIFMSFKEESSLKENNLLSIQMSLLSIISTIENYTKIVKHLRVLGISTKIENARLGAEGTGFSTIAGDVERLSEVINEKALQINHRSKILVSDVKEIITKIRILGQEQKKESELLVEEARLSLSSYQLSYNSSFESAGLIRDTSSKISSDINSLIALIQIQDIIRQQLEHIKENLESFSSSSSNVKLRTDCDMTLIKQLIAVCQLERAQVIHTKDEIAETASLIEKYNQNISLNANKILEHSGDFLSSHETASSIQAIDGNLSAVSGSLEKGQHINESLASAINALAGTMADSNRFVFEIEEIGAEIELIALNARIKAAHLGQEGAALGVLSQEIQKLSLEAKELSIEISGGLQKVLNATEKLIISNKNDQKTIEQEFKSIDGSLKNSLFRIKDSNSKLDSLKRELNFSLKEMKEKLDLMNEGLKYNFDVLGEITSVEQILEDYLSFALSEGIETSHEDKEYLKNLSSSYTMNSERKIHQSLLGKSENSSSAPEDTAAGDFLGDNIELF